jgi:predicted small lipoprotein YifL
MKSQLRPLMMAFLVLGLYGCGLKGPLYFPPAPKTGAPAAHHTLTTTTTGTQSPVQSANPGSDAPNPSTDTSIP